MPEHKLVDSLGMIPSPRDAESMRSPCNDIIMLHGKSSEQYHNFSPMKTGN
jgi:hypothetical protein